MQIRFKAALAAAIGAMLLAAPSAYAQGVTIHGSHAGMKCETCHAGQTQKAAPSQKTCLKCHGSYEALAKKTAKPGEKFNPHDSHMGRIECTQCHSMHATSHYICRDCHAIPDRKFKGE